MKKGKEKIPLLLLAVLIGVFIGIRFGKKQPQPRQQIISSAADKETVLSIDYGYFYEEYEQYFNMLQMHFRSIDNLLTDVWNDKKIAFAEKAHVLSMRDRLEMISVALNSLWFDEGLLAQKEFYLQMRAVDVLVHSHYAHKVRMLLDIVESQLGNIIDALSDSTQAKVTSSFQDVKKSLKQLKEFLHRVKTLYEITD